MTLELDDYQTLLEGVAPQLHDTLEGMFHEAARQMSPAGLHNYLEAARGLAELGRGSELVTTWLEEMPLVAREIGEDIIPDALEAAMKLSSMTSGTVISLLFASMPIAAQRLGDIDLVRRYLQFVHQLCAKAPRGLRPMFTHIDELLSKLTLGGLRRWADFGARAYRRDLTNLAAYFDLATPDSVAMLRQQRHGTLFIDVQRKLNLFLRAFWARDFYLRPAEADTPGFRPFVDSRVLHLPDAVDDVGGITGLELFRATAAHCAAHLVYSHVAIDSQELSPAQMFFIGLIEDARVEYCAVAEFPGLGRLWRTLLSLEHNSVPEHLTLAILEHAALMLRDPAVGTNDTELAAIIREFHLQIAHNRDNPQFSWHLGLQLFNLFAARREVPSLRILENIRIPYRDDNRVVWASEDMAFSEAGAPYNHAPVQIQRNVSVMEMVNTLDCENAGDDAQEVWRLSTPFWLDQEACTINELEGTEPISDPFHYPEWDYHVQLSRPDWVTVYERRQPVGSAEAIDAILLKHRPVTARIRQIIDLLQPEGITRERNMEDGDEIDLNAAVDAMIAMRMGEAPSPRITMRYVVKNRDLAVVVLLDLSKSTGDLVSGTGQTILDLTREACALVATAITGVGDPFAIHGFASDGRHDVRYFRFKDFHERFDDRVKARLAGMHGGLSTRMGAAMRHAATHLLRQSQARKLLLLVTDGEPADIDERDPQHLRHDARKAVEELHRSGIQSYCLTLDPNADDYVRRIFGPSRYTIVDQVGRLPEKLPILFATLTS
jgi:nitric oxide reductase NorD protein